MANANSARDAILTTYDIREARKYYDLAKVSNERIKILAEQLVVDVDKLRQDLEDSQAKLISSEEMKNSLRTAFSVAWSVLQILTVSSRPPVTANFPPACRTSEMASCS